MIELRSLIKQFDLNPVLRGVDLSVPAGQFMTLVGPNGAGKSTLMRIVATLSRPNGGTVTIGGWPLPGRAEEVRQHIGLISHQPLLYGDLTAYENLLFFARLYDLTTPADRVRSALKEVGLATRERDLVRTFSRGMLQRLTIARATLHEPDVLLLDEPYTGLDQEAAQMLDELLVREKETGRTIIMITHNLARGYRLSHRLAILSRGKIAAEIDPEQTTLAAFLDLYGELTGQGGKKQ